MSKYSREQIIKTASRDGIGYLDEQLAPISGPVLDWLPGESLFSLIARNHYYRGYQNPAHTIDAFLGTLNGRRLQNGSTELDVFVTRTDGYLGTREQVLEERTLFRFYRVFSSEHEGSHVERSRQGFNSMLKSPMNLAAGHFSTKHPLKACRVCLEQDQEKIGMRYWRLAHQFPGVWVCLEHDCGLQEVTVKPRTQQRFLLQTPTAGKLQPISEVFADREAFKTLRELTRLIISVTSNEEQGKQQLAAARERLCLYLQNKHLLLASGWMKAAYKHQAAELCKNFAEFLTELRRHPEFAGLPGSVDGASRRLATYVNGQSAVQPLEVLVIATWIARLDSDGKLDLNTKSMSEYRPQTGD